MNRIENKGFGNTSNITNNITINNNNLFSDIEKSLKVITDIFETEDAKINELLPHQVLINKTGQREQYKTEKIIRSLLNLGIPLVPCKQPLSAASRAAFPGQSGPY